MPQLAYTYPRISPDGHRLAVDIRDQDQDVWVWDFERETLTRLTFDPAADTTPLWTPDGQRIVFFRNGQGLRWQASDGTGPVESLTESGPRTQSAGGFTNDGKRIVFEEWTGAGANDRHIRILQLDGHGTTDLLANPKFAEMDPDLSPDGRWLAYESNESGRLEIYVRPFPDVQSGRWQISRDGGTRPMWARNGRELYFMAGGLYNSTAGSALMAVSVETSPAFRAGNPQQLLPGPYFSNLGNRTYDVSADGQRFLMVKRAGQTAATPDRIIVVDNWFEEFKRRVPVK
jgi:serine/threonine-protein kinase